MRDFEATTEIKDDPSGQPRGSIPNVSNNSTFPKTQNLAASVLSHYSVAHASALETSLDRTVLALHGGKQNVQERWESKLGRK